MTRLLVAESIYTDCLLHPQKYIYMMRVIGSEVCPCNEHSLHPKVCNCIYGCLEGDKCELWHHAEKEGAFKKVIFGVIGPDTYVDEVHKEMSRLKYRGGVYTLVINELSRKRGRPPKDNTMDIMREIETMEIIKQIDPLGTFTPTILYWKKMQRGGKEFESLQRIDRNIAASKQKSGKSLVGRHIEDVTAMDNGDIFFLYVTDAGETLESLIDLKYNGVSKKQSPQTQAKQKTIVDYVTVDSVVNAMYELEENYNSLARHKIGHCDLHCENITYRINDGKLNFNIIDFGFHNYCRSGQERNILHFLMSFVVFGNRQEVHRCIRFCDPVHYYMFILCFEMFYECISWRGALQRTAEDLHYVLVTMMSNRLFVDSVTREEDIGSMMGLPEGKDERASTLNRKYMEFLSVLEERYDEFYDLGDFSNIWKRVCIKTYETVLRYLENTDVHFLHKMQGSKKRAPVNQFKDVFSSITRQQEEVYNCEAFPIIFDDFCMAYYDKSTFDQAFLIQKFDKFSIAHSMVKILNSIQKHFKSVRVEFETDYLKSRFKLKDTVLAPQQLSIEETMMFLSRKDDEY